VKSSYTFPNNMAKFSEKRQRGNIGEDIACQFLERKGFRIVGRNYLRKWGEIDIIAEKGNIVRFIEVKSVSRDTLPDISREMDYRPEELVDLRKLRKLARTASLYMEEKDDDREYQIDVIGVIMSATSRTARCRMIEQALEDNL